MPGPSKLGFLCIYDIIPPWEFSSVWRDRFNTFSQNFITDPNLVTRLIKQSDISISDKVLEIGAGQGIITKQLSKACKQVIAVEIDCELYKYLAENFNGTNVTLINDNFLKIKLPKSEYKAFANIPFNYTSGIMRKLYLSGNPPLAAYLIMQKEAANMYLGQPRETQKSLFLKPFFDIAIIHNFRRSDFKPVPSVDTVMISIKKREFPYIDAQNTADYFDFIVYGTTQYKKTLKKCLDKVFTHEQFKRLSKNLEFPLDAKPLDLNWKQWVDLFIYYHGNVIDPKKMLVRGSYKRQYNHTMSYNSQRAKKGENYV